MIGKTTTLVIGAGASSECGLPTGFELKRRIVELLDIRFPDGFHQESGDRKICRAFEIAFQKSNQPERNINSYLYSAWRIRDAMPQALAIDNFIESHQGDERLELCAKLAIVRAILEAEKQSRLYFDNRENPRKPRFEALEDTWFSSFFQLLTENCRVAQLDKRLSSLTLIVFNYDRCLEHFLFQALQNYYGIKPDHAAELMTHLAVFHPYGSVGALPWQKLDNAIEFGGDPSTANLIDLAGQIRTFKEGTDPAASSIKVIRQKLLEAQMVLFLGFAYHRLNLELLKGNGAVHFDPMSRKYYGTAIGISDSDCELIVKELSSMGGVSADNIVIRNNLTCVELFGEYRRSLSLA